MPAILKTLITILFLWISGQVLANECQSLMPADARQQGQIKICQSSFTGISQQYSCQDYRSKTGHYRVIYKGGLEPKAIVKLAATGKESLIYSPSWGDQAIYCPLPAPISIPAHAKHRGIGICVDENNANIPCSVYEHAQARQSRSWRYLVFYRNKGQTEIASRMAAGDNKDAMVAELAFQLGLSLLETSCCSDQATAYLEHAHRLFPRVTVYRNGYLDALLEQLTANEEHNQ